MSEVVIAWHNLYSVSCRKCCHCGTINIHRCTDLSLSCRESALALANRPTADALKTIILVLLLKVRKESAASLLNLKARANVQHSPKEDTSSIIPCQHLVLFEGGMIYRHK